MTLLIYTNYPKKFKTRKEFKRHEQSNYELYESRPRKMIEFGHVCQESPREKARMEIVTNKPGLQEQTCKL